MAAPKYYATKRVTLFGVTYDSGDELNAADVAKLDVEKIQSLVDHGLVGTASNRRVRILREAVASRKQ